MQNMNDFLYLPGKINQNIKKIYAFDLDGTLTIAKNGLDPVKYNDITSDNWIFLGPVYEIIKQLSNEYNIFIITNQANISSGKIAMIESVYKALDYIPTILCAHKKNNFRKPNNTFINIINQLIQNLNINESYYCGDAVGNDDSFIPYRWGSDDSQFAINSGLKFKRPIDLFGYSNVIPTEQIVMMMGTPGSWKTTFAKHLEENFGYIRLSQDEIGDLSKQYNRVMNGIREGKKFVLDATFAKLEKRLPWIQMANNMNVDILICWIIRSGYSWNKLRDKPVTHFAFSGPHGYCKNFDNPEIPISGYKFKIEKIY